MTVNGIQSELARALDRPDIEELCRVLDIYRGWDCDATGPDYPDECDTVMDSPETDPDLALAFVMLAAAGYDDGEFLALVSASLLAGLLADPSDAMLARIVAEAGRTPRLRWMLSCVYADEIHPIARIAIAVATAGADCDSDPLPPGPQA